MPDIKKPVAPNRRELERFLPDQRTVKSFEDLFALVPSEFNAEKQLIQEALVDAGIGIAKANQALISIAMADRRLKSNEVMIWLSTQ